MDRDALARLKTIPLEETLKKLELSYESLEDDCKEIFLDVACFRRFCTIDKVIRMLESCGFHARNGLRVLQQKSLIPIDEERKKIHMHDHIIEMGKNIVRRGHPDEPHKHNRLWVQKEIEHILANDLGTEATRCIELDTKPGIVLEGLRNMKKLRCLTVNGWKFDRVIIDEVGQYFPNSLQYLYWNQYPQSCLPKTFEANNLVTLVMSHSKIKQLWKGGKVMEKLKILILDFSKLKSLDLGMMPNLERLHLKYCLDLVKIYVYGGCLKTLVYLNLDGCSNLKSISFIELLESLEVLHIGGSNIRGFPDYITRYSKNSLLELHLSGKDIKEVPSSIGKLHKLVSLDLVGCHKLKSLSGSISTLQHLRTLILRFTSIEKLPDDLGQLESLENLDLAGTKVKHLPGSICMLKDLKTLILRICKLIEELPKDVGQLESLVKLDLEGCCSLKDIPKSICKLKRLKELRLGGCKRLKKLPNELGDLECLQLLSIQDTDIAYLPRSISLLKGLKIYRSELKDKISDDNFIHMCSKYDSKKHQIHNFKHLRIIILRRCGIEELPQALGRLKCLEMQNLSYTYVKHLHDRICMSKRLKKLVLQRCVHLEKLPDDVGQLKSLEELYLSRCYSIRDISSSICMLKQLKILDLRQCFCLEKLPEDVGQLESLGELYITKCYNLKEIPSSIRMLKHLKKLELEGCRRLDKLSDELEDYIFGILA